MSDISNYPFRSRYEARTRILTRARTRTLARTRTRNLRILAREFSARIFARALDVASTRTLDRELDYYSTRALHEASTYIIVRILNTRTPARSTTMRLGLSANQITVLKKVGGIPSELRHTILQYIPEPFKRPKTLMGYIVDPFVADDFRHQQIKLFEDFGFLADIEPSIADDVEHIVKSWRQEWENCMQGMIAEDLEDWRVQAASKKEEWPLQFATLANHFNVDGGKYKLYPPEREVEWLRFSRVHRLAWGFSVWQRTKLSVHDMNLAHDMKEAIKRYRKIVRLEAMPPTIRRDLGLDWPLQFQGTLNWENRQARLDTCPGLQVS